MTSSSLPVTSAIPSMQSSTVPNMRFALFAILYIFNSAHTILWLFGLQLNKVILVSFLVVDLTQNQNAHNPHITQSQALHS